jgi:hypothetical protein
MLHAQGLSFKEIAAQMKRTGNTVANYLRTQFEIPARPVPSGLRHQAWKGGRSLHYGYWYIRLNSDDAFHSMCTKNGLVLEHRLVMARHLGRSLLSTESVHHINGEPSDNRIENLQLRQGKHGKHIVMACMDCGSHRIGPVPITED